MFMAIVLQEELRLAVVASLSLRRSHTWLRCTFQNCLSLWALVTLVLIFRLPVHDFRAEDIYSQSAFVDTS